MWLLMNCWHYNSVSLISLIFPIIARSDVHTTETLNKTNKPETQLLFLPWQDLSFDHFWPLTYLLCYNGHHVKRSGKMLVVSWTLSTENNDFCFLQIPCRLQTMMLITPTLRGKVSALQAVVVWVLPAMVELLCGNGGMLWNSLQYSHDLGSIPCISR